MGNYQYTIWILILPFAAFLFTGILSGKLKPSFTAAISIGAIGIATVLSYFAAIQYFFLNASE